MILRNIKHKIISLFIGGLGVYATTIPTTPTAIWTKVAVFLIVSFIVYFIIKPKKSREGQWQPLNKLLTNLIIFMECVMDPDDILINFVNRGINTGYTQIGIPQSLLLAAREEAVETVRQMCALCGVKIKVVPG